MVDSTCSAEYVAASVCCKQMMHVENMVQFLDFTCPRPYKLYTDSQACLKISTNAFKMGMVRHLEIRYHLIRCIVLSGDVAHLCAVLPGQYRSTAGSTAQKLILHSGCLLCFLYKTELDPQQCEARIGTYSWFKG